MPDPGVPVCNRDDVVSVKSCLAIPGRSSLASHFYPARRRCGVRSFARARGMNRSNYRSMPTAERQQLEQILMHQAVTSGPGVLWIAAGVSIVVFAILGLGIGFIRKAWPLAGLLPFLSLALNNPLSGYRLQQMDPASKFLIFACQCAVCYIFAYLATPRRHRI